MSSPRTAVPPARASRLATALAAAVLAPLALLACAVSPPEGIEPVEGFDAERYLGTWYEIARLDHRFERGLQAVSATYSRDADGGVRVVNRGWDVEEGEWSVAEGDAQFVEDERTGYLKVSFFKPFYGAYVVFELDPDYRRAYVTGDDRSYLWFLSRTPTVEPGELEAFRARADELGFDTDALIEVDQGAAPVPPPD